MIGTMLKKIGGAVASGMNASADAARQNANLQNGGGIVNNVGSTQEKEEEKKDSIFTTIGNNMKEGKGKDFMQKAGSFMKSFSDERLKEVYGDDDRIADLAKINSYDFTYKPEAQEKLGVDGDEHTGVMAQELENNPSFKGCVSTDPESGFKQLNIKELTAANTAAIGDLARRLEQIEKMLGDR